MHAHLPIAPAASHAGAHHTLACLWQSHRPAAARGASQVTEMKKKEAVNEKLMFDIAQENKRLTEPLSRHANRRPLQWAVLPPPSGRCALTAGRSRRSRHCGMSCKTIRALAERHTAFASRVARAATRRAAAEGASQWVSWSHTRQQGQDVSRAGEEQLCNAERAARKPSVGAHDT